MKKHICAVVLLVILVVTLSGCNILSTKKNSIGKSSNTVVTVYESLVENFKLRKKSGYDLYGVTFTANTENVGTYTFIYTDKRPDELNYSDILIVEINNRTGKIEKFDAPEYAVYGQMPYDVIKSAMPINPSAFALDSDAALKKAVGAHQGQQFLYNYVELSVGYKDGQPMYDISHISLVYNVVYKTQVNAMSGAVVSASVEEM